MIDRITNYSLPDRAGFPYREGRFTQMNSVSNKQGEPNL